MNLLERLALHLNHEVALQAEAFASEPGVLEKVGRRFIRVSGSYFVPQSLQEIVLLGHAAGRSGTAAKVRTLYAGLFEAELKLTGKDFIEVRVSREEEEEELTLLIPMGQIIGLEPV
ncbi:hypothetical protein [Paenibacillus mucilaginosus]|uniref:Uncharacterized protein n=1 Tax=Paenibacillus mucilaginosus (strain KNP414) TaxID=1036673 RepID=F8FPP7_PAEMK|nr:hypothetical protein [Paenibacillus mucilaginosus]AEI45864.1 hypothetical protein KNP414_07357 [Paenibacillus mucilaginosus KNP414]MCG7217797.1 hypothetical protein [Paenibacillus mucilaginosus]WDM27231.1 hypothetical protein KCX80_33375 [Paenibacillus mucilaginosus]